MDGWIRRTNNSKIIINLNEIPSAFSSFGLLSLADYVIWWETEDNMCVTV